MIKIKNFNKKNLVSTFYFATITVFQCAQHFYEKGRIREAQQQTDPTDPDADSDTFVEALSIFLYLRCREGRGTGGSR